jgi:hypothetical protein
LVFFSICQGCSRADIEKCQEVACKKPWYAYLFARDIPGVDIGKCQEGACKDPYWAYMFSITILDADRDKALEACKDTEWYSRLININNHEKKRR